MTIHATAIIKVRTFLSWKEKNFNNMLRSSLTDALTILGKFKYINLIVQHFPFTTEILLFSLPRDSQWYFLIILQLNVTWYVPIKLLLNTDKWNQSVCVEKHACFWKEYLRISTVGCCAGGSVALRSLCLQVISPGYLAPYFRTRNIALLKFRRASFGLWLIEQRILGAR